jgi:hypothetical protein
MPFRSKAIVGIDPGSKGGVVLLDDEGVIAELVSMPTVDVFADLIEKWKPHHVCIEKSQSLPGNAASRMYNYGVHNGELRGVLVALQVPFTLVPPKIWQAEMFLGTDSTDLPKKRALEAARRLFPGQDFRASDRCKTPSDGLVDAALIGTYWFRSFTRMARKSDEKRMGV